MMAARATTLPLVGRVANRSEATFCGVGVGDLNPHPECLASLAFDPPHKGEGEARAEETHP